MNPKKLIRDPKLVQQALKTLDDKSVVNVSSKFIKIYVPARWTEYKLASLGVDTFVLGVFAMVLDDTVYAVSKTNAMMQLTPVESNRIKIQGSEYLEFVFPPGGTVFKTAELVRQDTLVYYIYDEFVGKGQVPWYMNYLDMMGLFDTAPTHAGANIGNDPEQIELIMSTVARDPYDISKFYRQSIQSLDDLNTNPPFYAAQSSVRYSATDTTSRLAGAYFNEGLTSALINPSDRVERVESYLRQ